MMSRSPSWISAPDQRIVAGGVDRVAESGDRLDEPAVEEGVLGGGGRDVGRIVARRVLGTEVQDDSDLGVGHPVTQPLDGQAVTEEQVVGGGEAVGDRSPAGRHEPRGVAEVARAVRLVERRPVLDAVAEGGGHDVGVLGEVERRRPLRPAALVLEHLRQVPVIQRDVRFDAGGEQLVDETVVEVECLPERRRRDRRGSPAATRSRSGRRRVRARSSVPRRWRRARGGRRRRRRCCRRGSPREPCRSGPRCSRRDRPDHLRSGTTTSPPPTRTLTGSAEVPVRTP